jgi:oligosaccharyltransferase complex subunit delta (ribophorin II)
LGSKKATSLFEYGAGVYKIAVLAAGETVEPRYHNLGSVKFTIDESSPGAFDSFVAEKKSLYGPKPEIKHSFRQAEKVPPTIVSLGFTGLVLAPWLLLLCGVSTAKCSLVAHP